MHEGWSDDRDNDLHLIARTLPSDFDLVFDWREEPGRSRHVLQTANKPGCAISIGVGVAGRFQRTYGAAIDYYVSGISLRFHTHDIYGNETETLKTVSGFSDDWRPKNFAKPVGEWNISRVICRQDAIEYWLNGSKAFDIHIGNEIKGLKLPEEAPPQGLRSMVEQFIATWRKSRNQRPLPKRGSTAG